MPAYEAVYRSVRRSILNGDYKEGTRLTEEELAAKLGVSRTPVRDGLKKLADEGFVEFNSKRGAVVIKLYTNDILDIWRLRATLEGLAVELATERISDLGLIELKNILNMIKEAGDNSDWEKVTNGLMEFDATINKYAGNMQLSMMLDWIYTLTWDLRFLVHTSRIQDKNPYYEHNAIYEAICAKDKEKARMLMEEHDIKWGKLFIDEYKKR